MLALKFALKLALKLAPELALGASAVRIAGDPDFRNRL
jgi:hypothetical protein